MFKWLDIPKLDSTQQLKKFFSSSEVDEIMQCVEEEIADSCSDLTSTQHTADWFTLRCFLIMATISSTILNSTENEDDASLLSS
jgi:hypothetical protein